MKKNKPFIRNLSIFAILGMMTMLTMALIAVEPAVEIEDIVAVESEPMASSDIALEILPVEAESWTSPMIEPMSLLQVCIQGASCTSDNQCADRHQSGSVCQGACHNGKCMCP